MSESAFVTTSRILGETSNTFDVLRIIAGEPKIQESDRELIRAAADELEACQRAHVATYAQLLEAQQRLIAVNEQLIEARKAMLPKAAPKWSLGTGWIKMEVVK